MNDNNLDNMLITYLFILYLQLNWLQNESILKMVNDSIEHYLITSIRIEVKIHLQNMLDFKMCYQFIQKKLRFSERILTQEQKFKQYNVQRITFFILRHFVRMISGIKNYQFCKRYEFSMELIFLSENQRKTSYIGSYSTYPQEQNIKNPPQRTSGKLNKIIFSKSPLDSTRPKISYNLPSRSGHIVHCAFFKD